MSSASFPWKTIKLKKNGTPFSRRTLTLIDSADPNPSDTEMEDAARDSIASSRTEEADAAREPLARTSRQALVFVVVSLACASAAIAAGTYAVWLTRRQTAQNALTDVRDILKTCQDRMGQMEDDLHHLPRFIHTSPA